MTESVKCPTFGNFVILNLEPLICGGQNVVITVVQPSLVNTLDKITKS